MKVGEVWRSKENRNYCGECDITLNLLLSYNNDIKSDVWEIIVDPHDELCPSWYNKISSKDIVSYFYKVSE